MAMIEKISRMFEQKKPGAKGRVFLCKPKSLFVCLDECIEDRSEKNKNECAQFSRFFWKMGY